MKITFLGATQNVTGSRYLVESEHVLALVDCGLYQEREFLERNWQMYGFQPKDLDCIILTHAHLDHCGLLPRLVREGFRGLVYCTFPTADIAMIVCEDSARLQAEDVRQKKKRHISMCHTPRFTPDVLYTLDDVEAAEKRLSPVPFNKQIRVGRGMNVSFHAVGHIMGAAYVAVEAEGKRIIFSGDVGRCDRPILQNPEYPREADALVIESTYGDRFHEPMENTYNELEKIVNDTLKRGGSLLIPSFAIERSQDILYHLNNLLLDKRIPPVQVFVDSPMAKRVTSVMRRYPELYDDAMRQLVEEGASPFSFRGLHFTTDRRQSKALNNIKGGVIIIAGNGMCTGGRIKHHLLHHISRPESTLLFVGYQANHTLGRHLVNGEKRVRILGRFWDVKLQVCQLNGFSGHADRDELVRWSSFYTEQPKQVFVTHGGAGVSKSFAEHLKTELKWNTHVPVYGESVKIQ